MDIESDRSLSKLIFAYFFFGDARTNSEEKYTSRIVSISPHPCSFQATPIITAIQDSEKLVEIYFIAIQELIIITMYVRIVILPPLLAFKKFPGSRMK